VRARTDTSPAARLTPPPFPALIRPQGERARFIHQHLSPEIIYYNGAKPSEFCRKRRGEKNVSEPVSSVSLNLGSPETADAEMNFLRERVLQLPPLAPVAPSKANEQRRPFAEPIALLRDAMRAGRVLPPIRENDVVIFLHDVVAKHPDKEKDFHPENVDTRSILLKLWEEGSEEFAGVLVVHVLPFTMPLTSHHASRPFRLRWRLPYGPNPEDVEDIITRTFEVVKRPTTATKRIGLGVDRYEECGVFAGPEADSVPVIAEAHSSRWYQSIASGIPSSYVHSQHPRRGCSANLSYAGVSSSDRRDSSHRYPLRSLVTLVSPRTDSLHSYVRSRLVAPPSAEEDAQSLQRELVGGAAEDTAAATEEDGGASAAVVLNRASLPPSALPATLVWTQPARVKAGKGSEARPQGSKQSRRSSEGSPADAFEIFPETDGPDTKRQRPAPRRQSESAADTGVSPIAAAKAPSKSKRRRASADPYGVAPNPYSLDMRDAFLSYAPEGMDRWSQRLTGRGAVPSVAEPSPEWFPGAKHASAYYEHRFDDSEGPSVSFSASSQDEHASYHMQVQPSAEYEENVGDDSSGPTFSYISAASQPSLPKSTVCKVEDYSGIAPLKPLSRDNRSTRVLPPAHEQQQFRPLQGAQSVSAQSVSAQQFHPQQGTPQFDPRQSMYQFDPRQSALHFDPRYSAQTYPHVNFAQTAQGDPRLLYAGVSGAQSGPWGIPVYAQPPHLSSQSFSHLYTVPPQGGNEEAPTSSGRRVSYKNEVLSHSRTDSASSDLMSEQSKPSDGAESIATAPTKPPS
jgi:hypothetical protein